MGGTATLMRTAEKINAEYNLEKWASVRELIDAAIARHGDDLSRCFWEVVRQVRGKPGLERANTVYGGEIHELPRAAVWAGYHGTIAEILLSVPATSIAGGAPCRRSVRIVAIVAASRLGTCTLNKKRSSCASGSG